MMGIENAMMETGLHLLGLLGAFLAGYGLGRIL